MNETVKLCECGCGLPSPIAKQSNTATGYIRGQGKRFIAGHHIRPGFRSGPRQYQVAVAKRYRAVWVAKGKNMLIHRARAERALGKPLPKGAVVHHVDFSRSDDAPLVICQDEAYHKLLHWRMRVREAGGNPNTDKVCAACRAPKPRESFRFAKSQPYGLGSYCRECYKLQLAKRRRVA